MSLTKHARTVAVITTVLFFASMIWVFNGVNVNRSLEEGLKNEKLRSEELLSEKLLLEKDIAKMKDQLAGLKGKNGELDKLINSATARLHEVEAELSKTKKTNASIAELKKQRTELNALKNQLEVELQSAKQAYADLERNNATLLQTVAQLEERNRLLVNDLNKAAYANLDHTQIQASKKRDERITVKAARTRKLTATFDVPSSLQNVSYRVVGPNGKVMTADEGTIASTSSPSERSLVASADSAVQPPSLQKVEVDFVPKKKLKSGIYTIEVLNDNAYVSSMKVKLK